MRAVRIVYVDPSAPETEGREWLRSGAAGFVWLGARGDLESDTRGELSANTTHALRGHGVVDALNALELEGRVGGGVEAVVPPAALDPARSVFVDADRTTYGAAHEFVVARRDLPDRTEYRIRIDNREFQIALARLTVLATQASREGKALWIRI